MIRSDQEQGLVRAQLATKLAQATPGRGSAGVTRGCSTESEAEMVQDRRVCIA